MSRIGDFPSAYSVSGDGLMIYSEDGVHSQKMTVSEFVQALGDVIGGMGGGLDYWTETEKEIFRKFYYENIEFRTLNEHGKVFGHDVMTGASADYWDKTVTGQPKDFFIDNAVLKEIYGNHGIWSVSRVESLRYPALNEYLDQPEGFCDAHPNANDSLKTMVFHSNNLTFEREENIAPFVGPHDVERELTICQDRHYFGKIRLRCSQDIELAKGGSYINGLLGEHAPLYPSNDVTQYENFWVSEQNFVEKKQDFMTRLGAEIFTGWDDITYFPFDTSKLYTVGSENWGNSKIVDFIFNVSCIGNIKDLDMPYISRLISSVHPNKAIGKMNGLDNVIYSSYNGNMEYFGGYNQCEVLRDNGEEELYGLPPGASGVIRNYVDSSGIIRSRDFANYMGEYSEKFPGFQLEEDADDGGWVHGRMDMPWYPNVLCTNPETDETVFYNRNNKLQDPNKEGADASFLDLNPAGTGFYVDNDKTVWRVDFIPSYDLDSMSNDDIPMEFDGVPTYFDTIIRDHWAFDINEKPIYLIDLPKWYDVDTHWPSSIRYYTWNGGITTDSHDGQATPVVPFYAQSWGHEGSGFGWLRDWSVNIRLVSSSYHNDNIYNAFNFGFENIQVRKLNKLAEDVVKGLGLVGIKPMYPLDFIGLRSAVSVEGDKGLSGGIINSEDNYEEKYSIDLATGNFRTKGTLFEKGLPIKEQYQKILEFGDTINAQDRGTYVHIDVAPSSQDETYEAGDGINIKPKPDTTTNEKLITTKVSISGDVPPAYAQDGSLVLNANLQKLQHVLYPIGGHILFKGRTGTGTYDPTLRDAMYLFANYLSQIRVDGEPLPVVIEEKQDASDINNFPQYDIYSDINTSDIADAVAAIIGSLPPVTSSDNGKILKVNNGSWAAENLTIPDPLPSVTTSDNGKILGVENGNWSAVLDEGKLPSVTAADNGRIPKVINGQWALGEDEHGDGFSIVSPVLDYEHAIKIINNNNSDETFSMTYKAPSDGIIYDESLRYLDYSSKACYTIVTLSNNDIFKLGIENDTWDQRGDYSSTSLPIPKGMTITIEKNKQFTQNVWFIPFKTVSSFDGEYIQPVENNYSSPYEETIEIDYSSDYVDYTATDDGVIFVWTGTEAMVDAGNVRFYIYANSKPFPIGKGQTVRITRIGGSSTVIKFTPFETTTNPDDVYSPIPDYLAKATYSYNGSSSNYYGTITGLDTTKPYFVASRTYSTSDSVYASNVVITNMARYDTYNTTHAIKYRTRPLSESAPISTGYIAPIKTGENYSRRWYMSGNSTVKGNTKVNFDLYPLKKADRIIKNIFDILPEVTAADAGKTLTVDSNGNWVLDYPTTN